MCSGVNGTGYDQLHPTFCTNFDMNLNQRQWSVVKYYKINIEL